MAKKKNTKHYENRIRILNDYQATKDPNFPNFPLGTDRTWNYGHAKNTFLYVIDMFSEVSVSFKAFVTNFSIDINYNLKEDSEQLDGTTFYDGQPGFKYSVSLQVPAPSLNDARVNSSRIEALITMINPVYGYSEPQYEPKYVLLGNLIQNGRYQKHRNITKSSEIFNYGLPCYINNFKYEIDTEMGFFEDNTSSNFKLYPKNYKFNLELFATTVEREVDGYVFQGVLANTNGVRGNKSDQHGEIANERAWPFGVSTIKLIGE